jgi:hypothetical protein
MERDSTSCTFQTTPPQIWLTAGIVPPSFDADVIFVSSDRMRYGLHSKNLELSTGGFPPVQAGGLSAAEPVHLEEASGVLDLLFAFVYPMRLPKIEEMSFERVLPLAEAAEKYQVYPAMYACRMCLRFRK